MSSPIVGLYRNIYGIQPKWNRLYLEPHLTSELSGTKLRYWLRGQWYTIELDMDRKQITVGDFTVSDCNPLAVNVMSDTLEYFFSEQKKPSMKVQRSSNRPLELRINTWSETGDGKRKWTEICNNGEITTRHVVYSLMVNTGYKVSQNGAESDSIKSDASGIISFDVKLTPLKPQVIELKRL